MKFTKVEAEGARYAGDGVQILQGATVLGELFSSPGLQEQAPSGNR